ncbi:MAG: hypothetical protein AB8B87_10035 [Granulosicoccus sp.]
MGTVHQLPSAADAKARLLERLVSDMIAGHPNPKVASRWADMARNTLAKYPGPPLPTHPVLDLDSVAGLDQTQSVAIQAITEQWLQLYFNDVLDQLMKVHKDLLSLQKTVAEYEVENGTP